jgi:hypothetical protein
MKQLVYTFEREPVAARHGFLRPLIEDVTIGIAMAALGLPHIARRIDPIDDLVLAALDFPDDKTLLRFNLRIERTLGLRDTRIKKIRPGEQYVRPLVARFA